MPIPLKNENNFKLTADELRAAITPKTKLLVFPFPCNPTGAVMRREDIEPIVEVLRGTDIMVISDEIYEHINYVGKHESIAQFDFVKDRIITVNGLAKGFAMTGWRLGYIGAPTVIAKACDKMQGQFTSGTSSITQRAAIAALNESLEPTYAMRNAFHARRDLILSLFNEIEGIKNYRPDGAFYIFPDMSYFIGKTDGTTTINTIDDLSMYILDKAYISSVAGSQFGDDACIRFSYATSEDKIREAGKRLKTALSALH